MICPRVFGPVSPTFGRDAPSRALWIALWFTRPLILRTCGARIFSAPAAPGDAQPQLEREKEGTEGRVSKQRVGV
jgi:hypothetical protein